jgi:hypothetical protein
MDRQETCTFCGEPALAHCRRCGRPHCANHGADFCSSCSDPVNSVPSSHYVQVALWGLPVCVILGAWFLFGSPRLPGERAPAPSSASQPATRERSQTAPKSTSAAAAVSPTATASAADYTVKPGDTLASISEASGVGVGAILQLNPTIDASNLQIGQVLHMPPRSP